MWVLLGNFTTVHLAAVFIPSWRDSFYTYRQLDQPFLPLVTLCCTIMEREPHLPLKWLHITKDTNDCGSTWIRGVRPDRLNHLSIFGANLSQLASHYCMDFRKKLSSLYWKAWLWTLKKRRFLDFIAILAKKGEFSSVQPQCFQYRNLLNASFMDFVALSIHIHAFSNG